MQDAGAQLAAPLLDLRDGMRVLDACAAPGGKAAHILELADCALTRARQRRRTRAAHRGQPGAARLAATVVARDAAAPETWWDGAPFDRILLDVPCTASGVVRRHPDIKWLRRARDIAPSPRPGAHSGCAVAGVGAGW